MLWKNSSSQFTTPHGMQPINRRLFSRLPTLTNSCYRYNDSEYEYRHVQLPKNMLKKIPKDYFDTSKGTLKLLWEEEWRGLGITQVRQTKCIEFMRNRPLIPQFAESRLGTLRSS